MDAKKIVVHSMAYRGDVFPYVPIATALAERGHDVVFVVPREYHPLFAAEPFRCVHSGTDFAPKALDEHAAFVNRWGNKLGGAVLLRLFFGVFTVPHLDVLYRAIEAEVADADLLISHPAAAVIGNMAAERHDVPVLVGDLFPMLLLSEFAPMAGAPYLGRRFNRAMIRMATSTFSDPMTCAAGIRDFRRGLGLSVDGWNILGARLSSTSNLGLVPPTYIERQPDWPDNYRLVGFTPWSGPDGGHVDDEVGAFLDDGDPPVVVTLGTSAATARPEVFDAAIAALDRLGLRGVLLTSTEELAERLGRKAGGRHLVRPFAPLEPLLEHARAIVHSGAHGTNSLALLAGVPSVVVPCLFDQVVHARRQDELGTGVWVRRRGDVAGSLERVLGASNGFDTRARAFAKDIAGADGVAAAVEEAESLLGLASR